MSPSGTNSPRSDPPVDGSDPEIVEGRFRPPAGFREVAEGLEARGHEAWAVGGAVRDALAGDLRADWDIATAARPEEVRSIFRRTVPLGIEHGTVGVIAADGIMYEVTTFRRDVETDGRHAVIEFATSIDEDLARRDFTINALAWRPATDELRDPFGGRRDLQARVLRAVGDPAERFAEDYLRVLRGLRFAGRFELGIEPATRAALIAAVPHTDRLSAERVREELMKVLGGPRPTVALGLYREAGILPHWYPEIAEAAGDPRWELSLAAVGEIPPSRPRLRLARWLLPTVREADGSDADGTGARTARDRGTDAGTMASPATGPRAARAHGNDGGEGRSTRVTERAERVLARLKFSNADTAYVLHLLSHYRPLVGPADSSAELRRWLAEVGPGYARDLFRLHFAATRARGAEQDARALVYTWRRVHEEILARPPLRIADLAIDGSDLLALGVDEGPSVGIVLDELHAEVLEDPELNERARLEERARELIRIGALGADR